MRPGLQYWRDFLKGAARAATPGAGRDGVAGPSAYLDSFETWEDHRSLGSRISGRLSRHIPTHPAVLRNSKPIVTFTFDDVPDSALGTGAAMLDQAGVSGSFYISTALLGRRTEHWTVIDADGVRELHRRGHEIGLHGHAHLPVGSRNSAELSEDIQHNQTVLKSIDPGIVADNFAYPYGQADFARKLQLGKLVRSSRGIVPGLNTGLIDTQFIRSVPLEDSSLNRADIGRYLDAAGESNSWLVFFSHDVADSPSPFGVSKRMLGFALEGALRRGYDVVSMRRALDISNVGVP